MADTDSVSIYYFSAFGRGIFIAILGMNREVSRGVRNPGLETRLVSKPGPFSLKHEYGLDAVPTADSSCQLSESEMTKPDARNLQQRYGEIMSEGQNRLRRRGEVGIMEEQVAVFKTLYSSLTRSHALQRGCELSLRGEYFLGTITTTFCFSCEHTWELSLRTWFFSSYCY